MSDDIKICHICNTECKGNLGLSMHISRKHKDITVKEYYDKYLKKDNEGICLHCGKETKFININEGYSKFCSKQCLSKSDYRKEKIKETNLTKYGVEYYVQSDDFKQKSLETHLEKYNVDNYSKTKEYHDKVKETSNKRFGVDSYSKTQEFKERLSQTSIDKYGVDNYSKTIEYKQRVKNTNLERYGVEYYTKTDEYKKQLNDKFLLDNSEILSKEDNIITCKCTNENCNKCKEKQYQIELYLYRQRKRFNLETCTIKFPVLLNRTKDTSIELFVRDILDEYNIEYITNDRTILNGKELDIYIPSKNIAIEINGVYYHCDYKSGNKNRHLEKYNLCRDKNIQLITIWEDWIIHKSNIVKSLILSKLGIYSERIYARKCEIKEISNNLYKDFCNNYHIQGYSPAKYRYGLYYNDELLSIMSFGKSRFEDNYENIRYCTKSTIQVIGGASKLFRKFIKDIKPNSIVSYASKDISNGILYLNLGYTKDKETNPSYWYISKSDLIRYHRFVFRKSELIKKGLGGVSQTEEQIMYNQPYFKIYDCGQIKFLYKNI